MESVQLVRNVKKFGGIPLERKKARLESCCDPGVITAGAQTPDEAYQMQRERSTAELWREPVCQCQLQKEETVMWTGRKWSDRITTFLPHWT